MAEPTTTGELYYNSYLQTHAQRIALAQQMAGAEQANALILAKLYEKELANINNNIAKLQNAKSNKDFDRYLSLLQLENSTENAAFTRTLTAQRNVDQRFDTTPYEANIMQQSESFASNISGATSANAAAGRMLRQISPQVKGSDTAHALATLTYNNMKAAAARKGSGALAKFNSDTKLKGQVATHFGVNEGDIDTLAAYKEKKRVQALNEAGGPTVSRKQMQSAAKLAGLDYDTETGKVILPEGMTQAQADERLSKAGSAVNPLEQQRAAAEAGLRQQAAIAGRTPEDTMMRARQIYSTEFSPQTREQRRSAGMDQVYQSLPPEMQLISQGYAMVAPSQVKFMTQSRKNIPGEQGSLEREERELAYDLFYAAQKAKKAGKPIDFKIHEKAAEVFSEDRFRNTGLSDEAASEAALEAQKRVLGYIMRGEQAIANPLTSTRNKLRIAMDSRALRKDQERIKKDIEAQQKAVSDREALLIKSQERRNELVSADIIPKPPDSEVPPGTKEELAALQPKIMTLAEEISPPGADGLYPAINTENADQIIMEAIQASKDEKERMQIEAYGFAFKDEEERMKIEALVSEEEVEEVAPAPVAAETAGGETPQIVFGQTYYKGGKDSGFGYKFIDADTVQFVFTDGSVKKQKFGKGSAQHDQALEYFNATGK